MAFKSNLKNRVPRREAFKRVVTLVSHGYSNPVAWPDGQLTVYPWDSSVDEYLLDQARKSENRQTLLFKIIGKICDLNGADVGDMVADEAGAVLLTSRALSAGGTVKYDTTCPSCSAKAQETIKIPDELPRVGEKTSGYPGWDEVTLPEVHDLVRIRPLLIRDECEVLNRTSQERLQLPDNVMRMAMRILAVGGESGTLKEAVEYYLALSPSDSKFLENKAKELSPHLDTELKHSCDDCGKQFTQVLTFDQDFFR